MNNICGINKVDEWNEVPPIQSSVYSSQYVEVPCFTSLPRDDQTSLEFRFDKTDTAVDLSSMLMHLKLQIVKSDGKPIPAPSDAKEEGTLVAGTNLLPYSMFNSVEVFVSDQKINPGSTHYPWMCYVLNLLYESRDAKATWMQSMGWYQDDAFTFDNLNIDLNSGLRRRVQNARNSSKMDFVTKVMLDAALPSRVLPVQTEVLLRFNRSEPAFCLMAKEGSYRIRVNEAKMYVLKMRLTEQALYRQQQMLSEGVHYPCTKYESRTLTMMKGAQNVDWVPFMGKMPQKIYIWQISQEAFNGKININPFNLRYFNTSKVQVFVNEQSMIASQPTLFDTINRNMLYMNTIMNTTECPFNSWDFMGGNFVIAVDLTRDRSAGCNYLGEATTGNLRILLDYSVPLNESIVIFCMAEFDNILRIDKDRNPTWI